MHADYVVLLMHTMFGKDRENVITIYSTVISVATDYAMCTWGMCFVSSSTNRAEMPP